MSDWQTRRDAPPSDRLDQLNKWAISRLALLVLSVFTP